MEKKYSFNKLPESLDEFKALPEAALTDPYGVCALSVLAFMTYTKNVELGTELLNFLKGPAPLTPHDQQFIKDRFRDKKEYVAFSYCEGTSVENNYTPSMPYTIAVKDNPYTDANEGYKKLFLHSSGADSDRYLTVREKKSTSQWFLHGYEGLLTSIRVPAADDPWA